MCADRAVNALTAFAFDVRNGLLSRPKSLPPRYFYDDIGSALFEEITRLPEYYLTRTEHSILQKYADEIITAARSGEELTVLELGAGSAEKSVVLLRALLHQQRSVRFVPIDVSWAALESAVERLAAELPRAEVVPEIMDYTESLEPIRRLAGRKLILYIGSSIGNFEPFHAGALLRKIKSVLNKGDALLLGTDMRKPKNILIPAYDDAAGVTAAFNKNLLSRINRELDADFDVDRFRHRAIWNPGHSRIEMHLESLCRQTVAIRDLGVSILFEPGQTIHTENSYKFSPGMIRSISDNAGFTIERTWSDPQRFFRVQLLRA